MLADPYRELEIRFKRLSDIGGALAFLHWDTAAMMPKGGASSRADQLAALRALSHDIATAPEMADLLAAAKEQTGLTDWQRANLGEMSRRHAHATALPAALVERLSKAASACETTWREARGEADFRKVLPDFRTLLALVRESAAAKAEALRLSPYDALLDEYEPDGRSAEIDPIFADLELFLPDFLKEVLEARARLPRARPPEGPFPAEKQRDLGLRLMKAIGFDFDRGRLDASPHPFCGGTADDVRVTTRYDEADFTSAIAAVLHETGHALYELGLPKDWRGQPVGEAPGMSMHESQSLLIEMQVGRSPEFLAFALPIMKEVLGGEGPGWDADNLQRLYNKVQPSFIRVDADEVTYPAHVILRHKIERALIEGDMTPDDLPAAWNDLTRAMLGVAPPNDALGCLQDIHWFDGAWGYFPTYTLGAMTAAQLFARAEKDRPNLRGEIAGGDFSGLLDWLRVNIHGRGRRLSTRELLETVTGSRLDPDIFKAHLKARYLPS